MIRHKRVLFELASWSSFWCRVTIFQPHQLRLAITPGDHPGEGKPIAPKALAKQYPGKIAASLNGPWAGWGKNGKPPGGKYELATSMAFECGYFSVPDRIDIPPTKYGTKDRMPHTVTLGVDVAGKPFGCRGWSKAQATVAVQMPVQLICDGEEVTPIDPDIDWWSVFALTKDGEFLFLTAYGMLWQIQDVLKRSLDVVWAGMPDGGGSCAQVVGEAMYGSGKNRPTPSHIIAAPDAADAVITFGNPPQKTPNRAARAARAVAKVR